jgi:integrase
MKLSDEVARKQKLAPGQTDKIIFDEDIGRFGLRIRSSGSRVWIVQYRNSGGATRRLKIGETRVVSADQARKNAKALLAKVELGQDPQADKADAAGKARETFAKLVDRYLDERAEPRLRPRSLAEVRRHLLEHWQPFHKKSVHDITRKEVAARLTEIKKERGGGAANRARATLSAMFTWAVKEGEIEHNPVAKTNKPAEEKPRDRVLSDAEIAAIWKHAGAGDFGAIVRLLILTAQRRDEVGHMLRSEIDFDDRMWNIPGTRTKNGEPNQVPLSDTAIEILADIDDRGGSDHVFGIGNVRGFSGWSRATAALNKRLADAGVILAPWRLHDLRRSAATGMAELDTNPWVVEACLNHISGSRAGIAGVYNKATHLREKRQALDIWAAHVAALVAGKPASNVVSLSTATA